MGPPTNTFCTSFNKLFENNYYLNSRVSKVEYMHRSFQPVDSNRSLLLLLTMYWPPNGLK